MKIALLGDIAFFGKNDVTGNKNIYSYFADVAEVLNTYDYVVGNLETPFVTNRKPYGAKSAYIKAHPKNVELLKYLNINIVNLANNHIFDYGKGGYEMTKDILTRNNIQYFGVDGKQVYIARANTKVALHGYCGYSTNPLGLREKSDYGVNVLNVKDVEEKLRDNYKNGYFNIASFHIGQEHVNYPNYDHILMARQFSEICPYVFYGHHPHVLQGIEQYNESLIAYSLGNFCFDDVYTGKSEMPLIKQTDNNKSSVILELEIVDNQLKSYQIIPVFAGKDKMIVHSNEITEQIKKYSKALKSDKAIYIENRNRLITEYLESRKKLRDLKWYIKRLNFKSFLIIKNAILNKKKYERHVLAHLKTKES